MTGRQDSGKKTTNSRIRDDFEEPSERFRIEGALPFMFGTEMKRLIDSLRPRDGHFQGDAFRGAIAEIPEAFFGMI